MGRRDRERVPAIVPVRIWGTNRNEKPFSEHVCTVDISGTGARLEEYVPHYRTATPSDCNIATDRLASELSGSW